MSRDLERVKRVQQALEERHWEAVVCALPQNVLLLSGYWPVVGTSIAIATRGGRVALIVPEDERDLAAQGWADELCTFTGGSLHNLDRLEQIVRQPIARMVAEYGLTGHAIAYEGDSELQPATYASMNVYGPGVTGLLRDEIRGATLVSGSAVLERLRATLTTREVDSVRAACRQAELAFREGARKLQAGMRETEVAAAFGVPLSEAEGRAGGFTYCMSGPNSAEACAAYQHTRSRQLTSGDFALVHCNSYINGFWTDITRTFSIGEPDERKREMYTAVLEASRTAIHAVRPGVEASKVDRAAREVLRDRGFGKNFKHATGLGVGFAAINHLAQPCIHPVSEDLLEPGMTFNIEPAIYVDGYGGLRHCDVVTVTSDGVEVLTPFQASMNELTIRG